MLGVIAIATRRGYYGGQFDSRQALKEKKMKIKTSVRVEQRLLAELADMAIKERKTVSDLMREAILIYLARKA